MSVKRTDTNQPAIVRGLRQLGAQVWDTHILGQGCPDILVRWAGRLYWLEIKMPGGRLTADEVRWHTNHPGAASIVYSLDDALRAIGALEQIKPVVRGVKGEA